MSLQVRLAVEGRLGPFMEEEQRRLDRAVKRGINETSRAAQLDVRREVNRAFKGRRVGNTVRRQVFDNGPARASANIYTRFGRRVNGRFVSYLEPFETGATLRPKDGKFIYLPIGKRTRRRLNVARSRVAFFLPLNGKLFLARKLAKTAGRAFELIAQLVRRVRIPKKLDFRDEIRRANEVLARRIRARLD